MEKVDINVFKLDGKRKELLYIWDTYSGTYQGLLDRYHELLQKRREAIEAKKRLNLNRLSKETLKGISKIDFMEMVDRGDVIQYLYDLPDEKVIVLLYDTKLLVEGYSFKTISAWISETKYLLKNIDARKSTYGGVDSNYTHSMGPSQNQSKFF